MQREMIGRRVKSLLTSIVIGYVLVLLLLRVFESKLVFFPNYSSRTEGEWAPRGLGVEDVWLTEADGTKLHAWWIPAAGAQVTFLAFHGNAGNIADRAPAYEFLKGTPANVLAVEYRGYGKSEGKPSESGIYRDAEAGYLYLIETRKTDPKTIVSFGQSLGTAVAAHLAAKREVGAVVLEAPFPSATALANNIFWFLPGAGLLTYSQFDTAKRVTEIKAPLLVVHCNQDPLIAMEFGQRVFAAAHEPKTFLEVNGVCHEEASVIAPERYRATLRSFLREAGLAGDSGKELPGVR